MVVRPNNGFDDDRQSEQKNHEKDDTGKVIHVTDLIEGLAKNEEEEDKDEVSLTYEPDAFVRSENRVKIDIRGRYGRDVSHLAERIIGSSDEWG